MEKEFIVTERIRYRVLAETEEHAKKYVEDFVYKRGRRRHGIVSEASIEILVNPENTIQMVRDA